MSNAVFSWNKELIFSKQVILGLGGTWMADCMVSTGAIEKAYVGLHSSRSLSVKQMEGYFFKAYILGES